MDVWPLPRITFRDLNTINETRPTALITHPAVWAGVNGRFQLPILIQAEPNRDDKDFFEYLATNLPSQAQVIYAVGEGLTLDAAKLVASRNHKPLIIIPTAMSSDAPFTWTASVRESNHMTDVVTGPAEEVVIDLNVLQAAPPAQRAAGIVDVLSIVTALRDWTYADQKGQTTPETRMVQWATGIGASLAAQAIKSAAAMGKGDSDALHTLVDLLCMTVKLDSQLGHRRVSQGLEHVFGAAVKADSSVSHAERVGPGILLASALYNKDCMSMRAAMEAAGVRLNQLKHEDIRGAFNTLPDFARQVNAPYSMINDLQSNSDELIQAQNKSTLFGS
jgi:glycerol dehydrogenase-like iron-containing ADH family enzyme